MTYEQIEPSELSVLLETSHYLGKGRLPGGLLLAFGQRDENGDLVAGMLWKRPSSRRLPNDGSWAELSRWVLTPEAGLNAGSLMHRAVMPELIRLGVSTALTYADPSVGHSGTVYRACNYMWAPVWHELRPPPTGNGSWDGVTPAGIKRRYVFHLANLRKPRNELLLTDRAAVASWIGRTLPEDVAKEARLSPYIAHGLMMLSGRN